MPKKNFKLIVGLTICLSVFLSVFIVGIITISQALELNEPIMNGCLTVTFGFIGFFISLCTCIYFKEVL